MLNLVESSRPSDSQHRLEEVRVSQLNSDVDIYVDAVYIGQEATTDDLGRLIHKFFCPLFLCRSV